MRLNTFNTVSFKAVLIAPPHDPAQSVLAVFPSAEKRITLSFPKAHATFGIKLHEQHYDSTVLPLNTDGALKEMTEKIDAIVFSQEKKIPVEPDLALGAFEGLFYKHMLENKLILGKEENAQERLEVESQSDFLIKLYKDKYGTEKLEEMKANMLQAVRPQLIAHFPEYKAVA